MCGIAGYINLHQDHPIRQFGPLLLNGIEHRGPDGQYEYLEPENKHLFVHSLLKIMDSSAQSIQPKVDNKGNSMVFNGSIYNFQSLKEKYKLPQKYNDTETLFHLLKFNDLGIIAEIEGMFAVVYYDARSDSYLFARDRFGEKPLFYTSFPNGDIAFASERKSLWNIGIEKDINWSIALDYLCYHKLGSLQSLYHHISQIPSGSIMRMYRQDGTTQIMPIPYFDRSTKSFKLCIDSAVKDTSITSYPLAHTLSGGIDSSGLLAYAKKQYDPTVYSFTSPGYDNDESENVKLIANHLHIPEVRWISFPESTEQIMHDWAIISRVHEEPLISPSSMAQYYLYQKISEDHFRVLIEGQGSDELFCGYDKYFLGLLYDGLPDLYYEVFKASKSEQKNIIKKRLYNLSISSYTKKYHAKGKKIASAIGLREDVWEDYIQYVVDDVIKAASHGVKEQMNNDRKTGLFPYILRCADRSGMFQHLEIRLPYLHSTLVALSSNLHLREYWKDGYYKYYLRKRFSSLLPLSIVKNTKKIGFEAPYAGIVTSKEFAIVFGEAIDFLKTQNIIDKSHSFDNFQYKPKNYALAWKLVSLYLAIK